MATKPTIKDSTKTAQEASESSAMAVQVLAPMSAGPGALTAAFGPELANELAQAAKNIAAQERPTVSKITMRGGILKYQDQPVAGNKLPVVILAHSYENVWYKDRFDPNKIVNPNCFALSLDDKDMAPHEVVSDPQAEKCDDCPKNAWGSDPNGGRGKACKERRRLIVMPESALASAEDVRKAELALISLPVMSVKNWAQYVNVLNATVNVPPFAVITEITTEPDPKSQFRVKFTPTKAISSKEVLQAVIARIQQAKDLAVTPYDETAGETEQAPEPKKF